jgi:phasin family protein
MKNIAHLREENLRCAAFYCTPYEEITFAAKTTLLRSTFVEPNFDKGQIQMTQNNNPFADFISPNEFAKLFENYQGSSPFDMQNFLETQRKNMQALTQAQQLTIGNIQAIAQRQSEILSQMIEDNSKIAKEIISEGTPEQKIAKNAKLFQSVYERSVKNMTELSDMINKSSLEASSVINKRVTATMNEIQSSVNKDGKKAA